MNEIPAELRLTGQGIVLRQWRDEDLPAMVEMFDDPDVAYRSPLASPFDLARAEEYLRMIRRSHAEGRRIHLAITTDGREPRGEVLLNLAAGSLGYAVGAAYRGQGLAARAAQVMTGYAHQVLALPRVVAQIEPGNDASIGVIRAAGFHLADEVPELVRDKGRTYGLFTWAHDAPGDPLGQTEEA